jgi:hypothetical protein
MEMEKNVSQMARNSKGNSWLVKKKDMVYFNGRMALHMKGIL